MGRGGCRCATPEGKPFRPWVRVQPNQSIGIFQEPAPVQGAAKSGDLQLAVPGSAPSGPRCMRSPAGVAPCARAAPVWWSCGSGPECSRPSRRTAEHCAERCGRGWNMSGLLLTKLWLCCCQRSYRTLSCWILHGLGPAVRLWPHLLLLARAGWCMSPVMQPPSPVI